MFRRARVLYFLHFLLHWYYYYDYEIYFCAYVRAFVYTMRRADASK